MFFEKHEISLFSVEAFVFYIFGWNNCFFGSNNRDNEQIKAKANFSENIHSIAILHSDFLQKLGDNQKYNTLWAKGPANSVGSQTVSRNLPD